MQFVEQRAPDCGFGICGFRSVQKYQILIGIPRGVIGLSLLAKFCADYMTGLFILRKAARRRCLRLYRLNRPRHTGKKQQQHQDRKNAEYLRNDPKENAEHVMLVDLARNDLSRNCHGVHVDFYKDMQFYSHVIHLVSRVSGTLDKDADPIKAFIDTFPAGTLSGAPKVRAMQIISELEPQNRGAYGGCIGFIGFDRSLNQAITIRTFVSRNGELWFQAGGGIVAKSNEEYELQEVNNKLGALRKAIIMAEDM